MFTRFLLLLLLSFNALASSNKLEEIIETSWKKDLFIKAQESKISAAELDKWARFLPNNPNLTYSDSDNTSWRIYGGSIDFGLPGKAFALKKVDNVRYDNEKAELTAKKNEIAQFILNRYSECASSQELLEIMAEATEELETLSKTLTARYEIGQSTQAERIGMELQYRQAKIEFNSVQDRVQVACEKFQEVLGRYDIQDVKIDKTLTLPMDISPSLVSQI
jgi:outer membrane protein TolC